MRTKLKLSSGLIAVILSIFTFGCAGNESHEKKESVDKAITVTIYPTEEKDDTVIPKDSALIEETVRIPEIIRYGEDEYITVPFQFSDTEKYAKITAANIDRRIAVAVDGEVVYTPVVKMKLGNGACSVILSREQALELFPEETIDKLLNH